jgi:hypothetical protein
VSAQQEAIAANASLTTLLSYDSVWTGYAQNPGLAARSPFTTVEIARSFRGAIGKAVTHARAIATIASDGDYDTVAETLREALSTSESDQVALRAIDAHEGSVVQLARVGLTDLEESKAAEEEQLEADISSLFMGRAAAGNFGDRFLCGLAKASIAAGLITVWVPPHAHAAAAVGLGAAAYKAGGCAPPAQERARSKSGPKHFTI